MWWLQDTGRWGPSSTRSLQTQTLDPRLPGTRSARALNSAPSQESADSLTPPADEFLHLGLDARPAWPGHPRVSGGPASRPCGKKDRRCHCRQPSSGGLSWPKRDRYNSVLEDKENELVNTLVNFSRLKKELRIWVIP